MPERRVEKTPTIQMFLKFGAHYATGKKCLPILNNNLKNDRNPIILPWPASGLRQVFVLKNNEKTLVGSDSARKYKNTLTGHGREEYADEYGKRRGDVHHNHVVRVLVQRLNVFQFMAFRYVLSSFQEVSEYVFCDRPT